MACQPLNCVPRAINGGETIAFTLSDACHSAALWTMAFALNNGIAAPAIIAATTNADGKSFDVTISASASAALATGATTVIPVFTKIADSTVKEYGAASFTTVFPAITATAVPTAAQTALANCIAAIAKVSAATFSSTSFNGQSSTRAQLDALQKQKVTLQAEVLREQEQLLRARGGRVNDGRIQPEFVNPSGNYLPHFIASPFYP